MAADKLLTKIQLQIKELAPTLELFVDETVQPSATDCENLQKQLITLQESLAVYKYNKQNKELSPSFNIHAKVSEKENEQLKKVEIAEDIKQVAKLEEEEKIQIELKMPEPVVEEIKSESSKENVGNTAKPKSPLAIGINDKFRFINELFAQNSSEYNIALEQINNLTNWNEAEIYLNSLKSVYEWNEKEESVKYFYFVVKKRFD